MIDFKNKFKSLKKAHLQVACILFLIVLAVALLWFGNRNSTQATPALVAQVYFDGEYSVDGGPWNKIEDGKHIPATEGDVILRGNLHMLAPDGEYVGIFRGELPVAFYVNHINLTFYEGNYEPYSIEIENSLYGKSSCGESWTAYSFMSSEDDLIEIHIHNPHAFGNETAIDEMLDKIAFWTGIDFEKDALNSGKTQRNIGIMFMLVSLVFLGTALFSTLIHIKNSKIIWLLGFVVLFAGSYFAYSAENVSFWQESVVSNTTILGASMIFYMLFVSILIACLLRATKKIGNATVLILSVANALCFILPIVTGVLFYDTLLWWIAIQIVANAVLGVCLIKEFVNFKTKIRWLYIGSLLPLFAFCADVIGVWLAIFNGGVVSKYVFIVLFAVATLMVLKLIPQSINATAKAKELEMEKAMLNAELTETRISTMMSQIRPHFIYNTLGSIEQLCEIDPPKAGELVHDFAKYLRGNFGELDNPKPIPMTQEMEHVHHYVSIENVRFPDMTFSFEMNSEDFNIPALTIQPIVENAIKHGLMKLQKGGTIRVVSYETNRHYCVTVHDDGVGFDTTLLHDERKHVGLRNIRERLKAMVNGTMEIHSTIGEGTTVLIKIPKETRK